MATTDATGVPVKNQAYRVTFPILDADGDLVTGAGSLDSEISKDAGTFTDCTNEATEIATSSGMYYLDLTQTEMNADTVAVIVKSTGGKTTPIVLYPVEAGDIQVDTVQWGGTTVTGTGDMAQLESDAAVIEAKTSDTHSRLVVVEASVDSDQTSRATAISDVKSQLTVVEAAIDSDQTSRTAAISDVKSELVIISTAVATLDAAVDSDQLSRASAISDVHSRLVVVESSVDSDQVSRTAAISDIKSELVIVSAAIATLDTAVDSDQTSRTAAISDVHSRLVVVESSIDSDQTSRTSAISDVKSQLTIVASDTLALEAGVNVTQISGDTTAADRLEALMDGVLTAAAEGTPSTTVIQTDLAETTDDQYIGRLVTFLTGAAIGEQTDITDYAGSTGTLTVTALANAPAAGDLMVIH